MITELLEQLEIAKHRLEAAEKKLKDVGEYISCIDGCSGSPMWRIRTDIEAITGPQS